MRAVLVGVLAVAVYAATLAPGLTEIDSGELAAVAATLGVAHPSGYPLFSVLGRAWTVVTPGRVITVMNLLSALLAAGACVLVYRTLRDLLPARAPGRETAAVTGALAFAFHGTLWSVATVTEVHALQMFLDAALLHAVVRAGLWGGGPFRERAFLALGYLAALAVTNHLTAVWLFPAIALGAWRRRAALRPRILLGAVAAGALGLSVYAFLPLRSLQNPYLDWGSPENWETFFRHVGGAQYRVWIFSSAATLAENLPTLGQALLRFTVPLLLLIPAGWRAAARIPGALAGTVVAFAVTAAYPLGYSIHDIETYFLAPVLIAALWTGLGAAEAARWLTGRGGAAARAVPALALLPALPLLTGWSAADRSGDTTAEAMARAYLETPAPGAVCLNAHWDLVMSPVLYLQQVEGVRPDVTVLDQEHFRRGWKVPWLRVHHPDLAAACAPEAAALRELVLRFERGQPYDPAAIQAAFEALLNGLLEAGAARGGAYVTQEIEPQIGSGRVRIPQGLHFRLDAPEAPAALGPQGAWPDLPPAGEGGIWAERARGYAARMSVFRGILAARLGEREAAEQAFLRGVTWNPDDEVARSQLEALRSGGLLNGRSP